VLDFERKGTGLKHGQLLPGPNHPETGILQTPIRNSLHGEPVYLLI
jgi:hypothetical protein